MRSLQGDAVNMDIQYRSLHHRVSTTSKHTPTNKPEVWSDLLQRSVNLLICEVSAAAIACSQHANINARHPITSGVSLLLTTRTTFATAKHCLYRFTYFVAPKRQNLANLDLQTIHNNGCIPLILGLRRHCYHCCF